MTREDHKPPYRPSRGPLILWIALATLAATLAVGVTVIVQQNPTLSSELWPPRDTDPRPVP